MRTHFLLAFFVVVSIFSFPFSASASDAEEAAQEDVNVVFDGRPEVGKAYFFSVNTLRTTTYSLKAAGDVSAAYRRDTDRFYTSGRLTFNSSGLTYEIKALAREHNGEKKIFASFAGAVVKVVYLAEIPAVSVERRSAAETVSSGVLSGKASAEPDEAEAFEVQRLLTEIFSSPWDAPESYFGKSRNCKTGEKFSVNLDCLKKSFAERRIVTGGGEIKSFGIVSGRDVFSGIEVCRVDLAAESQKMPGYDFKFDVSMLIPVSPDNHGPVRMRRRAIEVTSRPMPPDTPFFSGATLEFVRGDETEFTLLPSGD